MHHFPFALGFLFIIEAGKLLFSILPVKMGLASACGTGYIT